MNAITPSTRVFFSFPEVIDADRHADYNAWHQLDHLPENLALPGVLHGQRWVRSPDCRGASGVDAEPLLSPAQYVAMYWFAEPAECSIAEWLELGATTLQLGRRPELAWTVRRMKGFFRPLRGHVAPRVDISAAALPYRPTRGVVLVVHRVASPRGASAERAFATLHHDWLPAAVSLPGVAGAWTFASREVTFESAPDVVARRLDRPGELRITVFYCDDDPVDTARRIAGVPGGEPKDVEAVLRTPLRTITPWQWNWFDGQAGSAVR